MSPHGFRTLLAIALLAALACCSITPKLEPKGRVVVPVSTADEPVRANVQLSNEVVIELPPIRDPGDKWLLVFNDSRFLRPLGEIAPKPDGGFTMRFMAMRNGHRTIRFAAVRPGVRDDVANQIYELRVEIE